MSGGHRVAQKDSIELDIWGCCVSRDIFSLGGDNEYTIKNYFQECSFVSAFSNHVGPEIDDSVFDSELGKEKPTFYHKCFKNDYNKTLIKNLEKSESEWLVLDLRYIQYGLKKIKYSIGGTEYITASGLSDWGLELLKSKGMDFDIEFISPHEFDYDSYFSKLVKFCKKKYGGNIILVEAREAYDKYNYFSSDEKIAPHTPCIKSLSLEKNISLEYKLNIEFMKRTGCYIVKCPLNNLSDTNCIWDPSPVHYVNEYYGYGLKVIDRIIQGTTENLLLDLEILYLEASFKLHEIRTNNLESTKNILHKIDNKIKYGNTELAFKFCVNLANENNADAMIRLSKFYSSGQGVERDLYSAADWLRRANKLQRDPNYAEFLNILWQIGTPESYDEMIAVLGLLIKAEVGYAYGWQSRLYRDGKGVSQDLDLATEYMRRAIEKNVSWARNEMFDILWQIGTQQAFDEAIKTIKPGIDSGDGYSMGRMGNAYYEGKGVEKNLGEAAKWMKRAVDHGCVWAQKKLDHIEFIINGLKEEVL